MKDMLKGAIGFGIIVSIPIVCASLIGAAMYRAGLEDGRRLDRKNDISREKQAV